MLILLTLLVTQAMAADYLLPGALQPTHYDLSLAFRIDPTLDYPFFGLVKIDLSTLEATDKIVLHAQNFNISEENVSVKNAKSRFDVESISLNDTYNLLTIKLDKELVKGENYTLTIPFYGQLKNGLDGVYISNYENKKTNGKEYLIATQFEAISARKGFPCFDEPMFKATFRINLAHEREFTAISNMPIEGSTNENSMEEYWPWETMNDKFKSEKSNYVWDQFETSVPMSTYLVAFVISKFGFEQSPEGLSKTKFKIWARTDALTQTSYAAQIGPKVLSYYEEWFGVPFPLPKQDMIAIPDFAAGAMENWGLITYRENALLYDPELSSFTNKERVAEVIAHELAHQWFGNLVTMKWWSDLWLNEGFATYVASLGVRAAEPSWQTELTDAADNMRAVWALDSLQSSHPVSVPIEEPSRISEIFDQISYSKGAVLIRMMTMFLGEDIFREALNNYLKKYSYKNAEQDDLWRELTAVSEKYKVLSRNVTVKEIMDTWTKQTGYPLLTVTRDYSDGSLMVNQKRYLALADSTAPSTSSWWVPLKVLCEPDTGRAAAQVQWLSDAEGTLEQYKFQHASSADQWLLFNAGMIAPYRVNYDSKNWQLLVAALRSDSYKQIPTLSRVQLVADAFELAWAGQINYTTTLELASYLQNETEYLPLTTGFSSLSAIESVLKRSSDYGAFQKFVRKLVSPTYERVGGIYAKKILNGDDLLSVKMQVLASRWACNAKVPGCEENAIEMFQSWMDTENPDEDNPIPLDLRPTVYCVALRRGSVAHWRFLLARQQASNVAAARQAMLSALACARDVWLLQQYIEWSLDGTEVRRQDAPMVMSAIAGSPNGYWLAKEFLYTRIPEIHKAFGGQSRRIGSIIKTVLNQFTTQKELDEFLSWREENAKYLSDIKLSVDQAIESAKKNIAWVGRHKKSVVDLMRMYSAMASNNNKSIENSYSDYDEDNSVKIQTNIVLTVVIAVLLSL